MFFRVIHFDDWNSERVYEQFDRWISFTICKIITLTTKSLTKQLITQMPKWRKSTTQMLTEPLNVILTPVSVTSLIVSWTCCFNKNFNFVIMYSPDKNISKKKWEKVLTTCTESQGVVLKNLPTRTDYTACVVLEHNLAKNNDFYNEENCDTIYLSPETIAPYGIAMLAEIEQKKKAIVKQNILKLKVNDFCLISGFFIDLNGNCVGI